MRNDPGSNGFGNIEGKEKMLNTSIFFFAHNVFYSTQDKINFWIEWPLICLLQMLLIWISLKLFCLVELKQSWNENAWTAVFFYNSTLYFRVFFCVFFSYWIIMLFIWHFMSKLHRLYMETCMLKTFLIANNVKISLQIKSIF